MIPRIRGNAIQKENGKWTFMILVGMLGSDECDEYNFKFDFETKEEALTELRKASQMLCEAVEKKVDGKASGKYIDMKTNQTRRWDKGDEN